MKAIIALGFCFIVATACQVPPDSDDGLENRSQTLLAGTRRSEPVAPVTEVSTDDYPPPTVRPLVAQPTDFSTATPLVPGATASGGRRRFLLAYVDDSGLWSTAGITASLRILVGPDLEAPRIAPDGIAVAVLRLGTLHPMGIRVADAIVVAPMKASPVPHAAFMMRRGLPSSGTWRTQWSGDTRFELRMSDLDLAASGEGEGPLYVDKVAWLPTSRAIVFSTKVGEGEAFGPRPRHDLWLWDPAGRSTTALAAPGQAGSFAFSPDGNHVATVGIGDGPDTRTLNVIDIGTGESRRLLDYPAPVTERGWPYWERPVWFSAGRRILLPTFRPDAEGVVRVDEDAVDLRQVDPATGATDSGPLPPGSVQVDAGHYMLNINAYSCLPTAWETEYFTFLASVQRAAEPGEAYPAPDRWWDLVLTGWSGGGPFPAETAPDMRFVEWSPGKPTVLYRAGDNFMVRRHDLTGHVVLALDGGPGRASGIRWAGDSAIAYLIDQTLKVETLAEGHPTTTTAIADDVSSFDVVPGEGGCG